MYVCMYVYIYTYIYIYVYIYIVRRRVLMALGGEFARHIRAHTHTHEYMYIYIYIPTEKNLYIAKRDINLWKNDLALWSVRKRLMMAHRKPLYIVKRSI